MYRASPNNADLGPYVTRLRTTIAALDRAVTEARNLAQMAVAVMEAEGIEPPPPTDVDAGLALAYYENRFDWDDIGRLHLPTVQKTLTNRLRAAKGEPLWCERPLCRGAEDCHNSWCSGDPRPARKPRRGRRAY